MSNFYYDFHIHSCLSPCGDSDMTPGNIAGMAFIKGLQVVALTDHNTCRNCPPFLKAAEEYGLIAIPGMELTTQEEVHVLCLFAELEDALLFDSYVYEHLLPIPNNPDIFGKQELYNEKDEVIGEEPYLLINATDISFDSVNELMTRFHGVMIPAHLDKQTTSLLSNLGFIPPDSQFKVAELHQLENLHRIMKDNPYLNQCRIICNSDAHYLEHIHEAIYTISASSEDPKDILAALQTLTL